jgi:opacity protein-like surface antigen
MRILLSLVAAAALAAAGQAQAAQPPHSHLTMAQRFEQANVTHDGHLTLEQAKTGYKSVARHFSAIDQDKKGYVTEDDIRAYYKTQRALHRQSSPDHRQPG